MDRSSPAAHTSQGPETAFAGQEQDGGIGRSAAVASPPGASGPGRPSAQRSGSPLRGGKDVVGDGRLERRDTAESCLSDFSSQRTNTGWSVAAASTATDLTDLNSPDVAFADEGFEIESYPSSPRRGNPFSRAMAYHKKPPFRAPSVSCSDPPDNRPRPSPYGPSPDASAPRHRRLEQMTLRSSSLGRQPSPSSPVGGGPGLSPRAARSPLGAAEAWSTDVGAGEQGEEVEAASARHGDREGVEHGPSTVGRPLSGLTWDRESVAAAERGRSPEDSLPGPGGDGAEDWQAVEGQTEADPIVGSDRSGSEAASPSQSGPIAAEEFGGGTGVEWRSTSRCSEASGSWYGGDTQPAPDVSDSMVHEACGQLLLGTFGVRLEDLALAGALPSAYETISYCLDELSRIALNCGLVHSGVVERKSTRGRTGSSAGQVWQAGGATDHGSAGGEIGGGGHGGGDGGRKRSIGGHDGAESGGGGGGGGGGKRQKIPPAHRPQSSEMRLSCPFRKRNPVRFNVRAFQSCAVQSFPDISQLKRHVKNFHKQATALPFTCPRCQQSLGTHEAFLAHLTVDRDLICNFQEAPSSADPEDGITPGIEEALNGRKLDSKIDSWESLWHLLFPGDTKIPDSDFVPPTELDEVYAQFNAEHYSKGLRQRLQGCLGHAGDVERLCAIFHEHVETIFAACRLRTDGVSTGRRRTLLPKLSQQTSRRQDSVRLVEGRLTPNHLGSGFPDSNPSPTATPGSASLLVGDFTQPLLAEPQSYPPHMPQAGDCLSGPGLVPGGATIPVSVVPGVGGHDNRQSATVSAPAHLPLEVDMRGHNNMVDPLPRRQLHHQPRLLSTDSGTELRPLLPNQQAADAPHTGALGSYTGYQDFDLGQHAPGLGFQTPRSTGQEPQLLFPASGLDELPSASFLYASALDHDGFEIVRPNSEWM